jgi:hypothetical protein
MKSPGLNLVDSLVWGADESAIAAFIEKSTPKNENKNVNFRPLNMKKRVRLILVQS